MKETNYYYICFQPRSGSTYLSEVLNNPEKNIVNSFELITRDTSLQLSLTSLEEVRLQGFSAALKKDVVDRYFKSTRETKKAGFKFSNYQIADDVPGFMQHMIHTGAKGIYLYRENIVETAISQIWSLRRSLSGHLPCIVDNEKADDEQLKVDEKIFEYYLFDSYMQREMVKCLQRIPAQDRSMLISYEELLSEATGNEAILNICKFLGIDSSDLAANRQKKRAKSSYGSVEDTDMLMKWIAQAKQYRFMDEHY